MKSKNRVSKKIYMKLSIIVSKGWLRLNGLAPHIFLIFLLKRKFEKQIRKRGNEKWICTNINNLTFPISEAKKYGLTKTLKNKKTGKSYEDSKRFKRGISSLITNCFLRIVRDGGVLEMNGNRFRGKKIYGLDTNSLKIMEKQNHRLISIERKIITSKVWLSLISSSVQVYLIFLTKIQWSRQKQNTDPIPTNKDILIFTYKEALEKYGITNGRFKRAIDELIEKGFLDINSSEIQQRIAQGGDRFKIPTIYKLSNRWQNWEKKDFIKKMRKNRKKSVGYCKPKPEKKILTPTLINDPNFTYSNNPYFLLSCIFSTCANNPYLFCILLILYQSYKAKITMDKKHL